MAEIKDILVPDVGGDEVEVIEICVAVGDTIAEEDAIVTVESDKASMDIPSSHAGVVKEIKIAVGDKVSEGTLLISVETSGPSAAEPVAETFVRDEKKVGRNEPCPCGSGKKYKQCHGKLN